MSHRGVVLLIAVFLMISACSRSTSTPTTIIIDVESFPELDAEVFLDSDTVTAILAGQQLGP